MPYSCRQLISPLEWRAVKVLRTGIPARFPGVLDRLLWLV
jgi:hypothetical protein